ncbi:MAG: hypothetical protein ABFC94_00215 [Syntrophomonas sp.]
MDEFIKNACTGSILAKYYSLLESVFRSVARRIDDSYVPSAYAGNVWDRELLELMTMELDGVMPKVLGTDTCLLLNDLREFRFEWQNSSKHDLSKILGMLDKLPIISGLVLKDFNEFIEPMTLMLEE